MTINRRQMLMGLGATVGAAGGLAWTLPQQAPAGLPQARTRNLERLKAYAEAKQFPTNTLVPDETVPVFFDFQTHVACAVGHLMIHDGLGETVTAVARQNNLVKINDLKDGPVLAWILRSGFTQEECALIQPGYDWNRGPRHRVEQPVAAIRMHLMNVHAFLGSEPQTRHSLALAAGRLGRGS